MAKDAEIFSEEDFDLFIESKRRFFKHRKDTGKKFQRLRITVKQWRPPKTSKQHRMYWAMIEELKTAFFDMGSIYNQEQLHFMVKMASGFSEPMECPSGRVEVVPKSIADDSEDISSQQINFLIDFIIGFAQEHLNYTIEPPEMS